MVVANQSVQLQYWSLLLIGEFALLIEAAAIIIMWEVSG